MALRPLSEINQQAIRLLVQELGSADATRFSRQFTTGYGDYTKERKELFKDWTLEKIGMAIEADRDTPGLRLLSSLAKTRSLVRGGNSSQKKRPCWST